MKKTFFGLLSLFLFFNQAYSTENNLILNDSSYFEQRGLNILVFNNWYNNSFDDSKMSGIEIIHHGVRTVTNGDVRLNATPMQWDPIPSFIKKEVDKENNIIRAWLKYPEFEYMIQTELSGDGIKISVHTDLPIPESMAAKVGFNIEFLPSAYFGKAFLMDSKPGYFPLYPSGSTTILESGETEPLPIAKGNSIIIAPENPERNISISSDNELLLYDGRNKAQNGWFVLRTILPVGKTGKLIEWKLEASAVPDWLRKPVISHSQVGYHPSQKKTAVVELDKYDSLLSTATIYKIDKNGASIKVRDAEVSYWGMYQRYKYGKIDFTDLEEEGIYSIEYNKIKTKPIRISADVYKEAWHPTNDIYLPVQMDHVLVNEAYRVWHGASHLDDALQAPVNHEHFDLYAQGPTTDTPFEPGEHIPGLNIGGWYDAGDYDIRTQTQYQTVRNLVHAWEDFQINRDEVLVDQNARYVDLHHPDGIADIIQQIEHGTLALIAQHRAVGHAIPGIIVSDLSQYTHLGDGITMTDNLIYKKELEGQESDGFYSGNFDDRWAFTSKSSALNYGSIAALAAASRVLRGTNYELAEECLKTAIEAWEEEKSHAPNTFRFGNTTGGNLVSEELGAATELLISTENPKYAERINELWPDLENRFFMHLGEVLRAVPFMDSDFKAKVRLKTVEYVNGLHNTDAINPFGVYITEGGWAGNGFVIMMGINNYLIHKTFPGIIDKDYVLRSLNYLYGCHPDSDISFVSGVGLHSKKVAYGMNRADFSFIAGGIVPGVLILKPDFPENKEDWPFLWGENEYVVGLGASYIYLVNAAEQILKDTAE
ncbi:MAG: glycoside hydrolase family 9 protein [Bacteroidales bacterium]|nr:glycoside hydrolase family 9 protein [Bacteroidales bacterium]MBN2820009.1 glycoside hydrolase family 9 protein [Bacteroidales bacterium]